MRLKLLLLAVAFTACVAWGADNEAAATKAAGEWLPLVDAGKYAESWDAASSSFKKAVTKEQWEKAVQPVRDQVGKLESRKLSSSHAVKDPPNAPEGDYMMVQYTSNFANKNEATEMVVMVLDSDKQWRTAGYFVK